MLEPGPGLREGKPSKVKNLRGTENSNQDKYLN